jgi:hypothetical protein
MSIFDKDIIQTLPDPQTYFEMLCEEEFGFNLTEGIMYDIGYNPGLAVKKIVRRVQQAYSHLHIVCYREGFGHLKLEVTQPTWPNHQKFNIEEPVEFR